EGEARDRGRHVHASGPERATRVARQPQQRQPGRQHREARPDRGSDPPASRARGPAGRSDEGDRSGALGASKGGPRRPPSSIPQERVAPAGAGPRSSKGATPPPSLPQERVAPAEPALEHALRRRRDGFVHTLGAGARTRSPRDGASLAVPGALSRNPTR